MRFLKDERRAEPTPDEKSKDMILLALRCLLLALLAVALARPAILSNASDRFGQSKVTAIIILDNSYSMGVSDVLARASIKRGRRQSRRWIPCPRAPPRRCGWRRILCRK